MARFLFLYHSMEAVVTDLNPHPGTKESDKANRDTPRFRSSFDYGERIEERRSHDDAEFQSFSRKPLQENARASAQDPCNHPLRNNSGAQPNRSADCCKFGTVKVFDFH